PGHPYSPRAQQPLAPSPPTPPPGASAPRPATRRTPQRPPRPCRASDAIAAPLARAGGVPAPGRTRRRADLLSRVAQPRTLRAGRPAPPPDAPPVGRATPHDVVDDDQIG